MPAQREWFEKDYYQVLGVAQGASEKEVSRAYKKLAKRYHPDQNPGDTAAEERFKEVSAAYDVLGDKDKRAEYDQVRAMVASGARPGGPGGPGSGNVRFDFGEGGVGLDDLLGGLFGRGGARGGRRGGQRAPGPERGSDLQTELYLEFEDAVHGATTAVRFTAEAACETCRGSGARPGTRPEACSQCQGLGTIAVDQGPFSFSQVCDRCGGRGEVVADPCPTCGGRGIDVRPREVKVRVPAGVSDGERIRVKGRGGAGAHGGPPGDLYVVVHVQPHLQFGRKGEHLTLRLPVSVPEAVLGAEVRVPTLDGSVTMKVPAGTPSGRTLRVRGRGIERGAKHGDLLVTIEVVIPEAVTDRQRAALAAFAEAFPDDPRAALLAHAGDREADDAG